MTRSSPEEEETTAVSFFLISNPPRRVISSLVLDFGCHSQDLFFTERFLRRILDPFSALMDNAPSNWTFSNDTSPSTSKTDRAVTPRPLNFCFGSIFGSGISAPDNRKILLAQL